MREGPPKLFHLARSFDSAFVMTHPNLGVKAIINYVLVARDEVLFVKSVSTGKEPRTGEYITDGESFGPLNLCAITTDNASHMKSSWNEMQDEYLRTTGPLHLHPAGPEPDLLSKRGTGDAAPTIQSM